MALLASQPTFRIASVQKDFAVGVSPSEVDHKYDGHHCSCSKEEGEEAV